MASDEAPIDVRAVPVQVTAEITATGAVNEQEPRVAESSTRPCPRSPAFLSYRCVQQAIGWGMARCDHVANMPEAVVQAERYLLERYPVENLSNF